VRRRPYSVILLDEFEKAHREVSNLLLQVRFVVHLSSEGLESFQRIGFTGKSVLYKKKCTFCRGADE
jgi:hypothetical protein